MALLPPTASEKLCLTCGEMGSYPTTATEPTCFDLSPAFTSGESANASSTMEGSQTTTYRLIPTTPESLLWTAAWDQTNTPLPSRVYRISRAGQEVSTETIRDLCGGTAPYIWQPKTVTVHPDTSLTIAMDSAAIYTTDGAAYEIDLYHDAMPFVGSRLDIPRELAINAQFERALKPEIDFLVGKDTQQCPLTLAPSQSTPPLPLSPQPFGSPQDKPDPTVCGRADTASPEAQQLANDHRIVTAIYDSQRTIPTHLDYDRWTATDRLAETDTDSGTMQFYRDLLDYPFYVNADPLDQQIMRTAVIAHELGHNLHFTGSNINEGNANGYATVVGLPATAATSADTTLRELGFIGDAQERALHDLSEAAGGTPDASPDEQPANSELMAFFNEDDFLRRMAPEISSDLYEYAAMLERQIETVKFSFILHYTACPSCAGELGTLYSLIILNPHFLPETKERGLIFLYDVVSQLPAEAIALIDGTEQTCFNPAFRAAFPESTPASMTETYLGFGDAGRCDLWTAMQKMSALITYNNLIARFKARHHKQHKHRSITRKQ